MAAIHCPHAQPVSSAPPPPNAAYHSLSDLLFCEDCDAVRCRYCVSVEVACYFCPNCLFEVPGASVRGEKNRCARNCFMCPCCSNVLLVVPSDPPKGIDPMSADANVGQPPYYLMCQFCRWDSKEVGLSFEKPTGLSQQLQKQLDSTSLLPCYDRVKDHIEPHLRMHSTSTSHHTGHGTANAASFLPSTSSSRYNSLFNMSGRKGAQSNNTQNDELKPFVSNITCAELAENESKKIAFLKNTESSQDIIDINEAYGLSWSSSINHNDLMPQRVPLRTKITKRCPQCSHILAKPDPKSSSIRFKIKLLASNYLPSIELAKRTLASTRLSMINAGGVSSGLRRTPRTATGSRTEGGGEEEPLKAGRTHSYELSFTNPLYEPIQVSLSFPQPQPSLSSTEDDLGSLPWSISVPASSFSIAAYVESWEYEDDEADGGLDEEEGRHKSRKRNPIGVLEVKANRTKIALDLNLSRDAHGLVKVPMLVTFTYKADDSALQQEKANTSTTGASKKSKDDDEIKTFSFWTMLRLGTVQPRPEPAANVK